MAKSIVKVIIRRNPAQCIVTIPKVFWDYLPESGYYYVTSEKGVLTYTPADVTSRLIKLPDFMLEKEKIDDSDCNEE